MRRRRPRGGNPARLRATGWIGLAAFSLGGCAEPASPSLPLFGAYFPSWLVCTSIGVVGAVAVRGLFVRLGIDDVLPWRLLVYTCLATAIGFVVALTVYGR